MSSPADVVELVVLLDEDGLAVDTSPKATVHHTETSVPLAFSCYLFGRHWRLLMTRRALHDEVDEARWVDWVDFRAGVPNGSREISPGCGEQVEQLPEDPRPCLALPPALRGRRWR